MPGNAPHILFVNPWIHDFAAFDFWARPMGLLQLAAIVRSQGMTISFVDCLDRFHPRDKKTAKRRYRHGRGAYLKTEIPRPEILKNFPRKYSQYGIPTDWFIQDLKSMQKPDAIMVTSFMTYWYPGVQKTIDCIRSVFKNVPVVLGGIYVRLCLDHAKKNMGADIYESGFGEKSILSIIQDLTGFNVKSDIDEERLDTLPYPSWDIQNSIPFVPLLTTRGCPFRCSYCASGFLEPKIRRRSIKHVIEEIIFWHKDYAVRDFVFYDDALLFKSDQYAKPLFESIVQKKMPLRFHTPNAIHIREITKDMAVLMFKAGFKNLRMGLETADFDHRNDQKLTNTEFEQAILNLKQAGFIRDNMGAYLLIGLPGQTRESIIKSIDHVNKNGIQPILAYYTPIPNTKLWQSAIESSPLDISNEPLLTNNTIFPCQQSGFDWHELSEYKQLILSSH
ncbi:Radical SAM domain protein [Candidatus Magnetomorum sp. HK-1]|nr:Radical SAM domain protein [Candidatus Magnetomorum sp. HK-1]